MAFRSFCRVLASIVQSETETVSGTGKVLAGFRVRSAEWPLRASSGPQVRRTGPVTGLRSSGKAERATGRTNGRGSR